MEMYPIKMTPAEWSSVTGNPRQRNTERHAPKIIRYLRDVLPQHHIVEAAELPNSDLVKLNGHSRSLLWDQQKIFVPEILTVHVFPVASMEDAKDMYKAYDASPAVETAADRVYGALREHNIQPESSKLQQGILTTTLQAVEWAVTGSLPRSRSKWDVNPMIKQWASELMMLDSIIVGYGARWTHSAVLAAMLLSIKKHGEDVVAPFWTLYLTEESGHTEDPNIALRAFMKECQDSSNTGGSTNGKKITQKALAAVEHGIRGNRVKKLYQTDMFKYLMATPSSSVAERMKRKRGSNGTETRPSI